MYIPSSQTLMKHLLAAILLCMPVFLYAQSRPYTTTNKEALRTYAKVRQSLDYQLYDQAITQLTYAVNLDPNFLEAQNQLADLLRLTKKPRQSIPHYLKILQVDANFNRSVYLNLGEAEVNIADYTNAQLHLQRYIQYPNITPKNKSYAELLLSDCIFSIEAIQHPVPFKPSNLGPEINTANDEYMPVLTADEGMLIFTRKINNNEDFYKSHKINNKWTNSVYLSKEINTPDYNEGAQSVTQDGRYLFFTGCDRPLGLGKCDIYVSKKTGNDWDTPYNLDAPVNSRDWESQPSISSDGRTLYFVSNRKGGFGGYDIWKSTLTNKGWGAPENLGPNINTPFDEQSPFIHPDDNTLYFSSNGWPGLGNMDVFISRKNSEGHWQKPVNLGYPINTQADDSGLTLNANGDLAYFSSNTLKGYGGFDIYSFDMPLPLRPQIVTYVSGLITDAKTKLPVNANVEIVDLQTSKTVYQNTSDKEGNFLSTLTYGKDYGLSITKKGYLLYSENFSLHGKDNKKQFKIEVPLQGIDAGNKVVLKNIFFDTNKYDLKKESRTELEKLVTFLNDNPQVKIELSGHTDDVGVDGLNKTLSQNRAKAVYNYLVAQRINATRLIYKGYGKWQAIAPNTTDEGRQLNRRTEFKIISN
jgi:outer membrane protein OmpA-like peptidoglycan-associated protein